MKFSQLVQKHLPNQTPGISWPRSVDEKRMQVKKPPFIGETEKKKNATSVEAAATSNLMSTGCSHRKTTTTDNMTAVKQVTKQRNS